MKKLNTISAKKAFLIAISICLSATSSFGQWADNASNLTTLDNVGIGTISPNTELDVNGIITTNKGIAFSDGSILKSANAGYTETTLLREGILEKAPGSPLGTSYSATVNEPGANLYEITVSQYSFPQYGYFYIKNESGDFLYTDATYEGSTVTQPFTITSNEPLSIIGMDLAFTSTFKALKEESIGWKTFTDEKVVFTNASVGIGTNNPGVKLDVAGKIHASEGIQFPDGTIQKTSATMNFTKVTGRLDSEEQLANTGAYTINETISVPNALYYEISIIRDNHIPPSSCGETIIKVNDQVIYYKGYPGCSSNLSQSGPTTFIAYGDVHVNELFSEFTLEYTAYVDDGSGVAWFGAEGNSVFLNGNVGIGTMTPKAKLSVEGTVLAKEVKVRADINNYPDFVFEDNYKLRSLEELQQYIDKNKHLPEIPSVNEAAANGVSLGEMNNKLLQKIEELTLYLLEMKKENDFLIKRVESLEKKGE